MSVASLMAAFRPIAKPACCASRASPRRRATCSAFGGCKHSGVAVSAGLGWLAVTKYADDVGVVDANVLMWRRPPVVETFIWPLTTYRRRVEKLTSSTAHALASSKEAFDTPLSPPPLDDEPGPATWRSCAYRDGTSTR